MSAAEPGAASARPTTASTLAPPAPSLGRRPAQQAFTSLRMQQVSRWYGRSPALLDLDLELARGEFVALLGPSGCGKSTALGCLAGLQPLTTGSIWRDDERIDVLPPERRGFGMVFQNYALFPHLSVQRNVEFGLRMRKVSRSERERRAREALTLVQLSEHAAKLPSQLSGGQQQRVAIARALAIDPDVVLMDEPLSNLDAALRVEMRTEIKRLYQERDLSVLYVTHDQEEALSLATRLVVLRSGRLEQTGTPEAVYTHPASAYVASFMGYRNLFPAQLSRVSGGSRTAATVAVTALGTTVTGTWRSPGDPVQGASVSVAVRPEDVVVNSPAAGSSTADVVPAVAEVVEYHGRELAVRARTENGLVLHLKTDLPVVAGARLALSVPPQRVLVYADSPTGDAPAAAEVGRGADH